MRAKEQLLQRGKFVLFRTKSELSSRERDLLFPCKSLSFRPLHKRKQICLFSEAHFASLAFLCLFR